MRREPLVETAAPSRGSARRPSRRASACARSRRSAARDCGHAVAAAGTRVIAPPTCAMNTSHSSVGSVAIASSRISIAASLKRHEVVALPVVARARRQQRIERRLPADERHRADDVARSACRSRAARRGRGLGLGARADVAHREHHDLACRATRPAGTAAAAPCASPPSTSARPDARASAAWYCLQHRREVGERMDDHAGDDLGPDRMQRNSNAVTTPKLPPPPRIAQKRSGFCSRSPGGSRRRRSRRRRTAGCRSSGRTCASIQPKPPPSVRPGDAGRRVDAGRHGEPVLLRRAIDVGERRAGLDARDARGRVDRDRAHRGEVEHEPAVDERAARDVVAAALHREQQARVARRTSPPRSRRCRRGSGRSAPGCRSIIAFQIARASS